MSLKRTCLIVGQLPDPHTEALATALTQMDVATVVISSDSGITGSSFGYILSNSSAEFTIHNGEMLLRSKEISTVFWRVKDPLMAIAMNNPEAYDADFKFREWKKAVGGLQSALPHANWINPYTNHWYAGHKLYQLQIAREVGLPIPNTIVSNRPADVVPLFSTGEVIYKTLSHPFHGEDNIILTTRVTKEEFDERAALVTESPCLFQSLIPKAYELRVTIIGDSFVAVKINSQNQECTKLDWRTNQLNGKMYELYALPIHVREKLQRFMRRLGLVYGAIDLIVTPDQQYVFLEVNPGGQWKWIEEVANIPLTTEIATYIATGKPGQLGNYQ